MYEIRKGKKALRDNTKITTFSREVRGNGAFEVEAGVGEKKLYFALRDLASMETEARVSRDLFDRVDGFEIEFLKGTEVKSVIKALKFITKVLEEEGKDE